MHKLIVGNWKMNGSLASNKVLLQALLPGWTSLSSHVSSAVCVPSVYLASCAEILSGSSMGLGAQDVSVHGSGAYTGEVSATMLRDAGAQYVIVGHSERRLLHHETDQLVAQKAQMALSSGLIPIVCVGESLEQRQLGQTADVVKRQLLAVIQGVGHCMSEVVVAYEPVWAIGTGQTATAEQAQEVHGLLRAQLKAAVADHERIAILYGGSMNAANAKLLLSTPGIDGGLIGGASLKPVEFLSILTDAHALGAT
jgi:triosephosphate isomerase